MTSGFNASGHSSRITTKAKPKQILLSTWEVILHILKGNIGAGALSLPYAFAKVGIVAGPLVYLFVVLICIYNMDLLLYCKDQVSAGVGISFGDLAKRILGNRGKMIVNIFLVGTQLSFCCVYFTVVATNLRATLPARLAHDFQERQLILLVFPIILVLSWIRSLHSITPFSAFANAAVLLGISIVFYYSTIYVPVVPVAPEQFLSWKSLPSFYGTAVYSFEGVGLVLPLEKDMQDKSRFRLVLLSTMSFILVLFVLLGELPVLAFGTIDNGSMTAVLHQYFPGWPVSLANILLAISCLFSFPIQFYPALEVLEKFLLRQGYFTPIINEFEGVTEFRRPLRPTTVSKTPPSNPSPIPKILEMLLNTTQYEVRRTLFRSMLCTSLMLVAVCVPNVGLLISLFGAVGSSMLAVIIPPVLYIRLHGLGWLSWSFHISLILFGVVGMIVGTIQAISDIVATF